MKPNFRISQNAVQPRAEEKLMAGTFAPASFRFTVRPHDIAGAVSQLGSNGREGCWIAFLFGTAKRSAMTDDQSLALQYSVIDGVVGLDWVLLGPRNVADASDLAHFARGLGYRVQQREMNSVGFLRVEDGDLAALGAAILEDLYGVTPQAELGLLIDGIVLSLGNRASL